MDFTAWVNRFANAGDAALEVAETTALRVSCSSVFLLSIVLVLPSPVFLKM